MSTVHTVRVRLDWLDWAIEEAGGMGPLAEKLECAKSTISRYARGDAEAGPRFIGATLNAFSIDFDDAFDVTEEQVRVRRARMVKQIVKAA